LEEVILEESNFVFDNNDHLTDSSSIDSDELALHDAKRASVVIE